MQVVLKLPGGAIKVHIRSGQKTKGLPKRVQNAARKAKYAHYLGRATCFPCQLVFRSPKHKAAHVASGHCGRAGVNSRRSVK